MHVAQALTYLKATGLPLALLINFDVPVLMRGVKRVVPNRILDHEDGFMATREPQRGQA